jgi:rare lipoprotein A
LTSLTKALITLVMVSLAGFTYMNENVKDTKLINNPEAAVNNKKMLIHASLVDYIDKGTMRASWYGPKFHGRKTANGELFDQMAYTAAHKRLRFGTLLRITNPRNHKSVVVRINDRGPYIPGRQLDLSKAAAMDLGMIKRGVLKLKVEEITLKGINFPVITLN